MGRDIAFAFSAALALAAGFAGYLYLNSAPPAVPLAQHVEAAIPKPESLHSRIDRDPRFRRPVIAGEPPPVPWPQVEASASKKAPVRTTQSVR